MLLIADRRTQIRQFWSDTARIAEKTPAWVLVFALIACVLSFVGQRALWLDEAMLTVAIRDTSWKDLLNLQSYNQATTLGHLVAVKAMMLVSDQPDFPMRAVSALFVGAGVISLCRSFEGAGSSWSARFFLIMCCGSLMFPRYASEIKPYALDFGFACGIIGGYIGARRNGNWRQFGFWSCLSVIFSYSCVFVVTGILVTNALTFANMPGKGLRNRSFLFWGSTYVLAFGCWHLFVNQPATAAQMSGFSFVYQASLLANSPASIVLWLHPLTCILVLFGLPLGLWSLFLFVTHIHRIKSSWDEDWCCLLRVLIVCLVLIYAASLAGLYPLRETRHFFFLLAIWMAAAAATVAKQAARHAVFVIIFAIALSFNFAQSALTPSHVESDIQSAASGFEREITHVYPEAQPGFEWYYPGELEKKAGYVEKRTGPLFDIHTISGDSWGESQTLGAWPSLWKLKSEGRWSEIQHWFARSMYEKGSGYVLFSDETLDAPEIKAALLAKVHEKCATEVARQVKSTYVIRFTCNKG